MEKPSRKAVRFLNLGPDSLRSARHATALHDVALELFSGMHHPVTVAFGLVAMAAPPMMISYMADAVDTNPHVLAAGLVAGGIALSSLVGVAHELTTGLREQARLRFPRPLASFSGGVAVVALTTAASLFSSVGQLDRLAVPSTWWEGPPAEKSPIDRLQLFLKESHGKTFLGGR